MKSIAIEWVKSFVVALMLLFLTTMQLENPTLNRSVGLYTATALH